MVAWFEIPVVDMDRAKLFYETVFNVEISVHDLGGFVDLISVPPVNRGNSIQRI